MDLKIKVDQTSEVPVYKQLIESVQDLISSNMLNGGDFLPSMNQMAEDLQISKETVKKAYSILRDKEFIESAQGKGFFVTNKKHKVKVLVLFDKLSTYKHVLFSSLSSQIGSISEITIRLHNQDIDLFEHFIEENLNKFDYYIITPHFPLQPEIQKRMLQILKRIPNRKLLVLDRNVKNLPGNFGCVYQDLEQDIYEGLSEEIEVLKKFRKLNVLAMPGSMYAPLILKGIEKCCREHSLNYKIYHDIDTSIIEKGETFLILNGQLDKELIELVRTAKMKGCRIGQDIGIISYNESPINEIILDGLTVFSTDFKQMGYLAGKMITEKSFKKIRCDFHLIRRSTF